MQQQLTSKKTNLIIAIFQAFYSGKFYQEVLEKWSFKRVIFYLIIFSVIVNLLIFSLYGLEFQQIVRKQFPDF